MAEQSETITRFREHLGGFFHDFLRASGITMTPGNANDRLRQIGERMARTIEAAAEVKAIEVIRRLQKAVAASFGVVEKELNSITELVTKHNTLIGALIKEQKAQAEKIERLQAEVKNLERGSIHQEWRA